MLKLDDLNHWRQEGLDRFSALGNNRKMHLRTMVIEKLRNSARVQFQCNQLYSLVLAILRGGTPFRPRTAFDISNEFIQIYI